MPAGHSVAKPALRPWCGSVELRPQLRGCVPLLPSVSRLPHCSRAARCCGGKTCTIGFGSRDTWLQADVQSSQRGGEVSSWWSKLPDARLGAAASLSMPLLGKASGAMCRHAS